MRRDVALANIEKARKVLAVLAPKAQQTHPLLLLPPHMTPSSVSIRVAARCMCCDAGTVRRMLKDGRLKGFRIGPPPRGPLRIHWSSLMEVMRPRAL